MSVVAGVWDGKCRAWSVKVRSVKRGVESVWSVGCEVLSNKVRGALECGV